METEIVRFFGKTERKKENTGRKKLLSKIKKTFVQQLQP